MKKKNHQVKMKQEIIAQPGELVFDSDEEEESSSEDDEEEKEDAEIVAQEGELVFDSDEEEESSSEEQEGSGLKKEINELFVFNGAGEESDSDDDLLEKNPTGQELTSYKLKRLKNMIHELFF